VAAGGLRGNLRGTDVDAHGQLQDGGGGTWFSL
jgi:hypothetical protein